MGENADFSGSIYQRYINQRIRYRDPNQSADSMHGPESISGFHAETSISGFDTQAPINRRAQYRDPHQSADWIHRPKSISVLSTSLVDVTRQHRRFRPVSSCNPTPCMGRGTSIFGQMPQRIDVTTGALIRFHGLACPKLVSTIYHPYTP